jgi:hypothetical protein
MRIESRGPAIGKSGFTMSLGVVLEDPYDLMILEVHAVPPLL